MPAARRLAGCLLVLAAVAFGPPGAGADPPALGQGRALERCLARIALFDEIIISRFDYRLLAIERWQLEEAHELRRRAEADCAAGELWFGLGKISQALILIGVPPSFGENEAGRGARGTAPEGSREDATGLD